jgi:lysophospholipase L1-like esterase
VLKPLAAFLMGLWPLGGLKAADWAPPVAASDAGFRWEGRVRFDGPNAVYDWAQVRLHAAFTGGQLAVEAATGQNYLDVWIDGERKAVLGPKPGVDDAPMGPLWVAPQRETYVVKNLGPGEHQLILAKRTGPNFGAVTLKSLRLRAGEKFTAPVPAFGRRLEFIGDSLTNGYGNEGPGLTCKVLPPYENSGYSWARLSADALNAEAHLLAYSGFGVVRNYGAKESRSPDPYPVYYPHTVLGEKAVWDRSRYMPDLVVVFLGTNDHSTQPVPDEGEFIGAYRRLIASAREGRGALPVLCLYPEDRINLAERIKKAVAQETKDGLPTHIMALPPGGQSELGCDWHPKVMVHQRWANLAVPKIAAILNWQ